ncbi:MAG: ATP synthase F0 subunit B [Acutalibacteraceae bacterium]|nr:ATP synthase F0 subunit B [Acutalibacteraceae bacterium]
MPLNIDLLQILLHVLNFVILAGGLSFLLFKPVNKFLEERKKHFDDAENEIKVQAKQNEDAKKEYEQKIKDAKEQINDMRIAAEKEAADTAKMTIERAKQTAQKIIMEAEKDAEDRKEQILDSAQSEIGELVVSATQKLLSDTVTPERNSALYDEFIRLAEKKIADKRTLK